MSENWVVWFNGKIVPETAARVPFRDRGFKYGDAAFDTTRTFGHRIFKLDEHLGRTAQHQVVIEVEAGV